MSEMITTSSGEPFGHVGVFNRVDDGQTGNEREQAESEPDVNDRKRERLMFEQSRKNDCSKMAIATIRSPTS